MKNQGQKEDALYRLRHSLAHVLAQAVLEMRPGSTLGFGPPIADGCYYDFILSEPLKEEDFPEIERRMKNIIKLGQKFEHETLSREAAKLRLEEMGEPYKKEYAEELFEKRGIENLTFYKNGPFLDMCEGPHVENTRQIPPGCFKLRSIAGAYWRGDSNNVMMTRIYVLAFESKEILEEELRRLKEAQERDHKKLGRKLEIYTLDEEIGQGLPLWLPNGTVIRDELEKLAKEMEFQAGYQRVTTPHITKKNLYYKTGHLPYYATHMYPFMEIAERGNADGCCEEGASNRDAYVLKPMNCPHHHRIFAHKKRSYRELPLRLAEYGTVYRLEDSGSLAGLLRVRCMTMNDAHIYCTKEQIKGELISVMEMHQNLYKILNLHDFYFRFSTWNPEDPKGKEKYVDNPELWETTQKLVAEAMDEMGIDYVEGKGEAAFYGPKIDVQFRSVTGREETASTNQLDFAVPERMNLTYVGPDNLEHRPFIIHRAPLGTHERFVAFLIEHFNGAFPTWLAPVQVRLITVSDQFNEYAQKIVKRLRDGFVRAELDLSHESVPKKIRVAQTEKIPNVLVIGERELSNQTVTLRRYGVEQQDTLSVDAFVERITQAIRTRSMAV